MLSQWLLQTGAKTAAQAADEGLAREKQEASRLGIEYPERKGKVGCRSRQAAYVELLVKKYGHIVDLSSSRWSRCLFRHGGSWWHIGMDVVPPEGVVRAAHAAVEAQEQQRQDKQFQQEQQQQQEEEGEFVAPKPKNKSKNVTARTRYTSAGLSRSGFSCGGR